MYIPILDLLKTSAHKSSTLSLYRSLLRNLKKLPSSTVRPHPHLKHHLKPHLEDPHSKHPNSDHPESEHPDFKDPHSNHPHSKHPDLENPQSEHAHRDTDREIRAFTSQPNTYLKALAAELDYAVKHEFRLDLPISAHSGDILYRRLTTGVNFNEVLLSSINRGSDADWVALIEQLVQYRSRSFKKQLWRTQNVQNLAKINEARNRNKGISGNLSKAAPSSTVDYKRLSTKRKLDHYEAQLAESRKNSWLVLCRYLKSLQKRRLIPNPSLLPYTTNNSQVPLEQIFATNHVIPGSTKHSTVNSAYDFTYINAILKPSLEFNINRYHYLDMLKRIVNERGPQQVKIRLITSGAIGVPTIRSPTTSRRFLKREALDVKRSIMLNKLGIIWFSTKGEKLDHRGQTFKDGSVSLKRSGGMGPEERIFPRSYYEDLAYGEGLWEFLLEKSLSNEIGQATRSNKRANLQNCVQEWVQDLDSTTSYLNEENRALRKRCGINRDLFARQKVIQERQLAHYTRQVKRLKAITENLRRNRVFKHSELVNKDKVDKTFDQYLSKAKPPTKKTFPSGIPFMERVGMGKTLGDYIDGTNFHNYKLGKRFTSRFKF